MCSSVLAALALVLLHWPDDASRAAAARLGTLLLALSAGAFLGAGSRVAAAVETQETPPVAPALIREIAGRIAGNPVRSGAVWRHDLAVATVRSESFTASARFSAVLETDCSLPPGTDVRVTVDGLAEGPGNRWYARANDVSTVRTTAPGQVRGAIYGVLDRQIRLAAGDAAPLLTALILGSDRELGARTQDLFTRAGVRHVLALSGMHLGILSALAVALLLPLAGRRAAVTVAAVLALLYTLMIGPRPSLVRATIMCEIGLIGYLSGRRFHLVELLAATFLVHLLVQPRASASLAFLLSYLALLGIAVVTPGIIRRLRGWVPEMVLAPLAAGAGAQVASAPVLFGTFGRIFPVGIVAGAVIGPMVAVLMGGGLVATVLSPLPGFAGLSAPILSALARAIEHAAWWFAGAPTVEGGRAVWVLAVLSALAVHSALACGYGLIIERRRLRWTGQQ